MNNYTRQDGMLDGIHDAECGLDRKFVTKGPLSRNVKYLAGYIAGRNSVDGSGSSKDDDDASS